MNGNRNISNLHSSSISQHNQSTIYHQFPTQNDSKQNSTENVLSSTKLNPRSIRRQNIKLNPTQHWNRTVSVSRPLIAVHREPQQQQQQQWLRMNVSSRWRAGHEWRSSCHYHLPRCHLLLPSSRGSSGRSWCWWPSPSSRVQPLRVWGHRFGVRWVFLIVGLYESRLN